MNTNLDTGITPRELLFHVNRISGGQVKVAASIMGFADHSAVCHLLVKHGVKWRSYRDFEYRGFTGNLRAHCLRLGVSAKNASEYRRRNSLTPAQALDYYVNRMEA